MFKGNEDASANYFLFRKITCVAEKKGYKSYARVILLRSPASSKTSRMVATAMTNSVA